MPMFWRNALPLSLRPTHKTVTCSTITSVSISLYFLMSHPWTQVSVMNTTAWTSDFKYTQTVMLVYTTQHFVSAHTHQKTTTTLHLMNFFLMLQANATCSHRQYCSPDDGHNDAETCWGSINHEINFRLQWHLVGFIFTWSNDARSV